MRIFGGGEISRGQMVLAVHKELGSENEISRMRQDLERDKKRDS